MESSEKVTPLKSGGDTPTGDGQHCPDPKDYLSPKQRDMGRVSVFVSILAVVLLIILFFGLNQNLMGLTEEVRELRGMRAELSGLDTRLGVMGDKVDAMEETMPAAARRAVQRAMLQEITQKLAYLSTEAESQEQADTILAAMDALLEVQGQLSP